MGSVGSVRQPTAVGSRAALGTGRNSDLAAATATGSIAGAAFNVYSQEIVQTRWRAVMSGASLMAWGLSSSIVSFGGGYIIAQAGYPILFLSGAGVTLVGALLFWVSFLRKPRGELAMVTVEADHGQ